MICPFSLACEVLEPRWTIQILTELWNGSTQFNDIRKGVGNIASALLSRRLKEMEASGLIERIEDKAKGRIGYFRTEQAINLEPAMNALAACAQCNIEAEAALSGASASTVMWTVRRMIALDELPRRRAVIRFSFRDISPAKDPRFWLVVEPGADMTVVCSVDPGSDVDLYVETSIVSLGPASKADQALNERRTRETLSSAATPASPGAWAGGSGPRSTRHFAGF
jgi:DNA-binding HxlR family transcriptional regulator